MPAKKKEFVPKAIYLTNQPVVILPLEQLEDFYEVHIRYQERGNLTLQGRAQLDEDLKQAHRSIRQTVRDAREYYKIQSVRRVDKSRKEQAPY